MPGIRNSILDTVGNTPVVRINNIAPAGVELFVKVEAFNPLGSVKGVARVLKARSPDTRVVACEPDNSQLLAGDVAQPYLDDGSPAASHPGFRPHLMQGWSPDFIPKLANDARSAGLIDRFMPIRGADALQCARDLAQKEGIFCGISAGATFAGALEVAKSARKGANTSAAAPKPSMPSTKGACRSGSRPTASPSTAARRPTPTASCRSGGIHGDAAAVARRMIPLRRLRARTESVASARFPTAIFDGTID